MSRIAASRLDQMYRRQVQPGWGPDYQPANKAVRGEAPSISRATRLQCQQLGRVLHLQSEPELAAALVALYCPALVGIQEQRILQPFPAPHPLAAHPELRGQILPSFQGTVDVMSRIDPGWRPSVQEIKGHMVVAPYVGDLLLALRDEAGIYCVNWTVKSDAGGFEESPVGPMRRGQLGAPARNRLKRRQAMEELYYRDVGIRTQQVTLAEIPKSLFSNLRLLYQWQGRETGLEAEARQEIVDRYSAAIRNETPPQIIMGALAQKYGCSFHSVMAILYQAIWARELKVDLYLPILVNKPLACERRDVLQHYSHWFAR